MIYVTGDTHGDQNRFVFSKEEKTRTAADTVIVCGDFGYLFLNDRSENAFLDDLEKRPYTLCFLDGNHENFPAIFSYPEEEWCGGKIHRIRKNVIHLMRGQVYEIEGKKIFTFGGAYSIDRYMRKLNYSYWEEEIPNSAEYHEAIYNLDRHNRKVDIILSHTCPREIIRIMGHYPDEHDIELTGFLEFLMYEIDYSKWFFGHWHRDEKITDKFTAVMFEVITL